MNTNININKEDYKQIKSEVIEDYKALCKKIYIKYSYINPIELRIRINSYINEYYNKRLLNTIIKRKARKRTKLILKQKLNNYKPDLYNFSGKISKVSIKSRINNIKKEQEEVFKEV